jgi:hypothetical protein
MKSYKNDKIVIMQDGACISRSPANLKEVQQEWFATEALAATAFDTELVTILAVDSLRIGPSQSGR